VVVKFLQKSGYLIESTLILLLLSACTINGNNGITVKSIATATDISGQIGQSFGSSPTLTVTNTNVQLSPTNTSLPTPSITAVSTETLRPTQSPSLPTLTATATKTASPTPTVTPLPSPTSVNSSFHRVVDFPTYAIWQLYVISDGTLWASTINGLFAFEGEKWTQIGPNPSRILGSDLDGRNWVLFNEGTTIGYLRPEMEWVYYGENQGWNPAPLDTFGKGIVVDRNGDVWMALGRNGLRHLDTNSNQWQIFQAADVGFPPPVSEIESVEYDPVLAFTDVALDSFGNVWASACAVWVVGEDGPEPVLLHHGQGVRWFDGDKWAESTESADRCIYDIEVGSDGRVWLAGPQNELWQEENTFVRYDPNGSTWEFLPVPETSEMYQDRPRYARDFWFGRERPWLRTSRRGGASFPPDAVYYLESERWVSFLETETLALGADGEVYAIILDPLPGQELTGMFRSKDSQLQKLVDEFPWQVLIPDSLTVDGNGRIWFIGQDRTSLWYYEEP